MSWIKKMLGSRKTAPSTSEAAGRLSEIQERLEKRSEFLETKINEAIETAKSHAKTNKKAAMMALKKKKRYEKEQLQLDNTISTVEYQRDALQNAHAQAEIFSAMQAAGLALESAFKKLNIDDIEDIREKWEQQHEDYEDIVNAISRPLAAMEMDEDEFEEELDRLREDDLTDELCKIHAQKEPISTPGLPANPELTPMPGVPLAAPSTDTGMIRLPSVPCHTPAHPKKAQVLSEEDEMAELASWAS